MKIVLATPEFEPDAFGGGAVVFSELANEFERLGHDVTVLTQRIREAPRHQPGVLRLRSARSPVPALVGSMPPWPWHVPAMRKVLAAADIVNVHGYGYPFVAIAAVLTPGPSVLTLHGFPVTPHRRAGAVEAVYSAYERTVARRALQATKLTAVSSAIVRDAAALTDREITVIPNGVRVQGAGLPREAAAPYLLCVGRSEWYKGFETAIDALACEPLRESSLRLIVAGRDGGMEAALRQHAARAGVAHRVDFAGVQVREAVLGFMRGARALVVPSTTESFSLVAVEAMAVGCPVIATGVGGMADYCEDSTNVLEFPVGDAERLAALVIALEKDDALRDRLVRNGRVTAARFEWPSIAKRYVEVFEAALGTRGA
jgi:glycogen(starch) synthase